MEAKVSLLFFLAVLSMVSAAPSYMRLRREVKDPSDESSETIKPGRQSKAINLFSASTDYGLENNGQETLKKRQRQNKALAYFDYLPQFFATDDDYGDDEITISGNDDIDDDDISRTIPSRRKQNPYKDFSNTNALGYENSPIYYIRLPPTPYMFVPGLGYISQPPSIGPPVPPPVNPFINLPLDFVSNGKPTGVYQWNGAPAGFPSTPSINAYNPLFGRPSRPQLSRPNDYNFQRPFPAKKPASDSKITNLNKGPYGFNGKPNDIFVLRDSYNSLYSDALQNFYP